jgi:regulation of enolase protein 1 (concanavalin A-like superfamily)
LGYAYLARGNHAQALECFERAVLILPEYWDCDWTRRALAAAVSGLEAAYGDAESFRAFCRRLREEHSEVRDLPFAQWYLEPAAERAQPTTPLCRDGFTEGLSSGWTWLDPLGDCAYRVEDGLEIHAANGRDLWLLNLSAPRLLREASGDLVLQTTCLPASDDRPAIGGLLLWADEQNYLRLDRGAYGGDDVSLGGCLGNEDLVLGRGRLYEGAGRVTLCLERRGERVEALCSADGEQWFTVGHAAFPAGDPVQVGVHAIGDIDRSIYPSAYPEGTAIRFESFEAWEA